MFRYLSLGLFVDLCLLTWFLFIFHLKDILLVDGVFIVSLIHLTKGLPQMLITLFFAAFFFFI